jgi:putative transcriptional regulator
MRKLKPTEIKAARENLGLSQAQFAKTFRLSLRTLQHWEQGVMTPRGAAAVLLWLISRIPQQIIKTLRDA